MKFSSDNKFARIHKETHSCFNQLKSNSFEVLLPEVLSSYKEFSANLKFNDKSMSHAIISKFNS